MISQKQQLLDKMEADGFVNSYDATYKMSIKQAPTRIYELKKLGHNIITVTKKDGSVDWYLKEGRSPSVSVAPPTSPSASQQYVFTPDGHAIPKENLQPEQLKI